MSKHHIFPKRRRIAFRSIFASRLGVKFAAAAGAALLSAALMYFLLSHGLFQWLYGRLFGMGAELTLSPQRFQRRAEIASIVIAAVSFFLVMLPYVFRTIRRITHLNDEMEVLTGGDLSYSIEARGKDELADLARSIEAMRLSVLEQMTQENEAVLANSRLITSLSHDLRTPLTRLMGYLEIMRRMSPDEPEQLRRYLDAALENAMQMKTLSDEMFSNFRVRPSQEDDCGFETLNGALLFGQLISELCAELQDAGFTADAPEQSGEYSVYVRVFDLRRIFNNIFSNIKKYADPAKPVRFDAKLLGDTVEIRQSNSVLSDSEEEGHGIGLPTMQMLTERNGGRIEAEQTDELFRVSLFFPIRP